MFNLTVFAFGNLSFARDQVFAVILFIIMGLIIVGFGGFVAVKAFKSSK